LLSETGLTKKQKLFMNWIDFFEERQDMKENIKKIVTQAARRAFETGRLQASEFPAVEIEEPKFEKQGDFSTNIAMASAALQKTSPRKIAEAIIDCIVDSADKENNLFDKLEIAGPGFINFFIRPSAWHICLKQIHQLDQTYGSTNLGNGEKIQVEFVSANPTGPLHVGHGRGAAVGDVIANIYSFCGYDVFREYYINDSGRQIKTLGRSVFLRYEELFGRPIAFPGDCYQGGYIRDIAATIQKERGNEILLLEPEKAVLECARFAAKSILDQIRVDLQTFGVVYDNWFSEQSLYDNGKVDAAIDASRKNGFAYEQDGALWFKTSAFGDEKDRVVVRSNGDTTYFASDIAYHLDKFNRGFCRVIDVWGADHHGYIPRMRASVEAFEHRKDQFDVVLIQLVNLLREGEPVAMSTRSGEFVTLEDVVKEVGRDAARFIFLTRHHESPLDFDLELAKKKSNDNPVYYVQYVHARISSILRNGMERGIDEIAYEDESVSRLTAPEEIALIKALSRYPEAVRAGAELMEPHRITFYLITLASVFHAYYNKHRVLSDDPVLTRGRLCLVSAVKKVIQNGLSLLGVTSPEKM
jgi:arginyl-tRNA synthetase